MNKTAVQTQTLNAGMVGMGMIFEETYRPVFEHLHKKGLYDHTFGFVLSIACNHHVGPTG